MALMTVLALAAALAVALAVAHHDHASAPAGGPGAVHPGYPGTSSLLSTGRMTPRPWML